MEYWNLVDHYWVRIDGVRLALSSHRAWASADNNPNPAWTIVLPLLLSGGEPGPHATHLPLSGDLSAIAAMETIDRLFPLAPWMTQPVPVELAPNG